MDLFPHLGKIVREPEKSTMDDSEKVPYSIKQNPSRTVPSRKIRKYRPPEKD